MDLTRFFDSLLGVKKKEEQQPQPQAMQKLLSAKPQIKNSGAVNLMLDKGASYEDIANKTGVDLGQVRSYADTTRPGYGVKKIAFQQPKPVSNPITDTANWWGKIAQDFGKGVGDTLTSMVQAVPRAVKAGGLTLSGQKEYTPQNDIEKAIYGSAPVKNLSGYARDTTTSLGNLAGQKDFGKNMPEALALPVGLVLAAGDLTPVGGVKKGVVRAGETAARDVANNLDNAVVRSAAELPTMVKQADATPLPAIRPEPIKANLPPVEAPAAQLPAAMPRSTPTGPINVDNYVQDQVSLQQQARKPQTSVPAKIANVRDDFKRTLVDSFAPIEDRLNLAIKNGAEITPETNIKPQYDRVLRADQIATQHMKDSGLVDVIQKVPDVNKLEQYMIAKHAQDLEGQGIKTGRNLDADKQLIQALAPEYEPYAKSVNDYSQTLLDRSAKYGLISPELASGLKEKYPNYVPMNRIFGENELPTYKAPGAGPASLSKQSVVQKIKGSERQVESPLSSLIDKTQDVVKQGEINKTSQILASYKDLPGNPFGIVPHTGTIKPGESTITLLNNGVQERYVVDKAVADAAKSLTKEQMGLVGKILSYPTRVLRLGATGLNPAFALANITKDAASAIINSKHPIRTSVANPHVFLDALKAAFNHGSSQYAEIMREGAGGTSFDIARDAPVQNVKMIRSGRNAGAKTLYTVTHPGQLLRAFENTIGRSEELTRAMQYFGNKQAALKSGESESAAKIIAADAARNNTVNFARAGDYGRVLNSVLPYLNAGVQGSRTLLRNLKDRPAQTVTKIVLIGSLPVATTTAWNLSDPKRKEAYDDIADYEKEGNIIIIPSNPVKDDNGRWNAVKIPVSQEIANLNNIVRNGIESLHNDKSFDFGAMASGLIGTATSVNPSDALNQVIPQALKPFIETVQNKNLYTGKDIVPDKFKNLSAPDQIGDYTSGTAQLLGKTFNASPLLIDNAIKTSGAGLSQNVVNLADNAMAKLGIIKPEDVGGKSFGASVMDRFAGAQSTPSSEVVKTDVSSKLDEMKKLPEFQQMSRDEQAKALNRLEAGMQKASYQQQDAKNQTGQFAPDYTGKAEKLSDREASLLTDKPDVASYLTTQTSKGDKSSKSNKEKYDAAKSEFAEKNVEWSDIERAKKSKSLAQLKVKSEYSNDLVDLYNMSKTDALKYLEGRPNSDELKSQLLKYGDALKAAGLGTNKFRDKNGNESFTTKSNTKKSSTGTTKKSSSTSSKKSKKTAFKAPVKSKFSAVSRISKSRNILAKTKITRSKTA